MSRFNPTTSINGVIPSQCKSFSCGEIALDDYLKRYAKNHEKLNIGRTFVLLDERERGSLGKVLGYYTLNTAQIDIEEIPETHRKKLPRYPIPASRLCRLAVDQSSQGKGIGEHLLMDAIKRVLQADALIAVYSLIVDAKNEKAKKFYSKYGFLPLKRRELALFLPLATLKNFNA